MAQAPIEAVLSARGRTFLGDPGQELERINPGVEILEAPGIIACRGGGRDGKVSGRERGGMSSRRGKARGPGGMPSAGRCLEGYGADGLCPGGRGGGAAHLGGRASGGSPASNHFAKLLRDEVLVVDLLLLRAAVDVLLVVERHVVTTMPVIGTMVNELRIPLRISQISYLS